ncbi:MAG TPA: glycosyltransferase family 4 protein [Candidatus Avacidaminococcus intestinavium]|uniref:Glycosyltransferase family 4 protein n=1 Tax=Candidatus Avacidaminococcus intestinavium TaxID=2840684 RepID=A0A9D1SL61_9FIRM|nr:glycosyltransferase family 4 protein [Candidatus Avacidaminococcus intestinavium]
MKNVLLIVPRMNIGGAETYTALVARTLAQKGYQVFLASGGGKLADELAKQGIKTFLLPIRLNYRFAAFFVKKIVKKYKIDIIHANSAAAGFVAALVRKELGTPFIYTAHGIFSKKEYDRGLFLSDKIICVSNYVREKAIKDGCNPEQMITCYNGIDVESFENLELTKKQARDQLQLPPDAFIIGIISRIKNLKHKGHGALLNILAKKAEAKEWHLVVVGKGKGLLVLNWAIKKAGLSKRVHCLGHLTNVKNVLVALDTVAVPSRFETFGLALAEGMAVGKPVVAYQVGGVPELVSDGKNGFLVEIYDEENLFNKLKFLADNPEQAQEMGLNGQRDIREKFSSAMMVKNIVEIYDEVLK